MSRRFYFYNGNVQVITDKTGSHNPLQQILIEQDILTTAQFNHIKNNISSDQPLGNALLNRRILTTEMVQGQIADCFVELIYSVFRLPDAYFFFSLHQPGTKDFFFTPESIGEALTFDATSILMESARREDEWKRIQEYIPDLNELFIPVAQQSFQKQVSSCIEDTGLAEDLVQLLNGTNTLKSISRNSHQPLFNILQATSELIRNNFIKPVDEKEKTELALRYRRKLQFVEAAELYDSILKTDPENLEIRKELVSLLEKNQQENPDLNKHRKVLAEQSVKLQDCSAATEYLRKVLSTSPKDIEALFLLCTALFNMNKQKESLIEAHKLIQEIREYKKRSPERVIPYIEGLVQYFPKELSFQYELAKFQEYIGDTEKAITTLKKLASIYEQTGATQNLRKTYEYLSQLDKRYVKFYKKLVAKEEGMRRQRFRLIKKTALYLFLFVLATGFVSAVISEILAYRTVASAEEEIDALLTKKEYDAARELLEKTKQNHPISTTRFKIMNLRNKISRAYKNELATLKNRTEEQKLKMQAVLSKATILKSKGELTKALSLVTSLSTDLLPKESKRKLSTFTSSIQGYLEKADRLSLRAIKAESREQWKQAFDLWIQLLTHYPESPEALDLHLPLKIETTPSKAEIWLNDQFVGTTPHVLHWPVNAIHKLELRKKTYARYVQTLSDINAPSELEWFLSVSLNKKSAWEFSCTGTIESAPVVADKKLVAGDRSGKLYSLAVLNGTSHWQKDLGTISGVSADLQLWNGNIVCFTAEGNISVFSSDGALLFNRELPVKPPIINSVSIAETQNLAVLVSGSGAVCAFSLKDQKVAWMSHLPKQVKSGATVIRGQVFVGDVEGTLWSLDLNTGRTVSKRDLGGSIHSAPVVLNDGRLAVGTGKGLFILNAANKVDQEYPLSNAVMVPPAYNGEILFVATSDGYLQAFNINERNFVWKVKLETPCNALASRPGWVYAAAGNRILSYTGSGKPVWTFTAGKPIWTLSIAGENRLAAGSEDKKVRLFDLQDDS